MILGIGTDIVSTNRIRSIFESNKNGFIDRVLSDNEKLKIQSAGQGVDIAKYVAKRFAAKEAFAKAIGLGIGRGVNFKDISVINDENGKPIVEVAGKEDFMKSHFDVEDFVIHISLADEEEYAIAYCVIEGK